MNFTDFADGGVPSGDDYLVGYKAGGAAGSDRRWKVGAFGNYVFSVAEFGAVGDGVTDDTAAFQAACDAAAAAAVSVFGGASVFAPAGFQYLLNGVALTATHNFMKLQIDGSVIVPPGSGTATTVAITLTGTFGLEININYLYGQEGLTRPNSTNHRCAGVKFVNSGNNILHLRNCDSLTEAIWLLGDGSLPSAIAGLGNCQENHLYIKTLSNCWYGVRSEVQNQGATEGTWVIGGILGSCAYAIYKPAGVPGTDTQGLWYVRCQTDSQGNVDAIADIFDNDLDADGRNASRYDLTFVSHLANSLNGAAFTDPRSALVVCDQSQNSVQGSGPVENLTSRILSASGVASLSINLSTRGRFRGIKIYIWHLEVTSSGASLTMVMSPDGTNFDTGASNYGYASQSIGTLTGSTIVKNLGATEMTLLTDLNSSIAHEIEIVIPISSEINDNQIFRWNGSTYASGGEFLVWQGGGTRKAAEPIKAVRFNVSAGTMSFRYSIVGLAW